MWVWGHCGYGVMWYGVMWVWGHVGMGSLRLWGHCGYGVMMAMGSQMGNWEVGGVGDPLPLAVGPPKVGTPQMWVRALGSAHRRDGGGPRTLGKFLFPLKTPKPPRPINLGAIAHAQTIPVRSDQTAHARSFRSPLRSEVLICIAPPLSGLGGWSRFKADDVTRALPRPPHRPSLGSTTPKRPWMGGAEGSAGDSGRGTPPPHCDPPPYGPPTPPPQKENPHIGLLYGTPPIWSPLPMWDPPPHL